MVPKISHRRSFSSGPSYLAGKGLVRSERRDSLIPEIIFVAILFITGFAAGMIFAGAVIKTEETAKADFYKELFTQCSNAQGRK